MVVIMAAAEIAITLGAMSDALRLEAVNGISADAMSAEAIEIPVTASLAMSVVKPVDAIGAIIIALAAEAKNFGFIATTSPLASC